MLVGIFGILICISMGFVSAFSWNDVTSLNVGNTISIPPNNLVVLPNVDLSNNSQPSPKFVWITTKNIPINYSMYFNGIDVTNQYYCPEGGCLSGDFSQSNLQPPFTNLSKGLFTYTNGRFLYDKGIIGENTFNITMKSGTDVLYFNSIINLTNNHPENTPLSNVQQYLNNVLETDNSNYNIDINSNLTLSATYDYNTHIVVLWTIADMTDATTVGQGQFDIYNSSNFTFSQNLLYYKNSCGGGCTGSFNTSDTYNFNYQMYDESIYDQWIDNMHSAGADGLRNTNGIHITLTNNTVTPCIENWIQHNSTCNGKDYTIIYTDSNKCGTIKNLPLDNGTTQKCCTENWLPQLQPARCTSGTQLLTYTDSNKCNTTTSLPKNNGTTQKCCVESWAQYLYPSKCLNGTKQVLYTDRNNCNTTYFLPANNGTIQNCSVCNENWVRQVTPAKCTSGTQLITYTDAKKCGTTDYLPIDNGTTQKCCAENWTKQLSPSICLNRTQTILYTDQNKCGTTVLLPSNNGTIKTCCVEDWSQYLKPTKCANGTQQILYKDNNHCSTILARPADYGTYQKCCVEAWIQYLVPTKCTTGRQEILYADTNKCGTINSLPANNGTFAKCKIVK